MAGPIQLIGFISKWVNARLIKFIGPTGENKIEIPDNLANALEILEATNSYIKFITTNGSEEITLGKNTTVNANHVFEGASSARQIVRQVALRISAGNTPNTDLAIIDNSANLQSIALLNEPTIEDASGADAANSLAKSETVGSFNMNAGGTRILMDTSVTVTAILASDIHIHNLNNSSTTEVYFLQTSVSSSNTIELFVIKRGSNSQVDWTTIIDAGDLWDFRLTFVTSD